MSSSALESSTDEGLESVDEALASKGALTDIAIIAGLSGGLLLLLFLLLKVGFALP